MTLKLSQLRAKLESGIEFYDGAFFLGLYPRAQHTLCAVSTLETESLLDHTFLLSASTHKF